MNDDLKWLEAMVKKRPETLLVLHALVLSGIRTGHVSAEDAHHIPVSHPNCRGAAMKYIHRFGFVKDCLMKGTTKQSKGHYLWRWVLQDRRQAERLMIHVRQFVASIEPDGQLMLPY